MDVSGMDVSGLAPTGDAIVLPARPEPIRFEPARTALVVVDMQNAYASKGGYLDIAGFDISGAAAAIDRIATAIAAARSAGIPAIFLQNGWDADYVEAGGPGSPNWHKSNAMKTMRRQPALMGQLLAKGGWDYAIVDALKPQPGDVVIAKTRYSVFYNTNFDSFLRARHPQPGVHRDRHQRLRGILAAGRVPPRILRHCPRGRHASSRTGVRAAGGAV
jgi:ureidoacrylate peracid hydrolase